MPTTRDCVRNWGCLRGRRGVLVFGRGAKCLLAACVASDLTALRTLAARLPLHILGPVSSSPAPDFEFILEQARRLPEDQQLRLVEALQQPEDDELDPELRAELIRRLRSIEDGTAVLVDHDEMMAELRAQFTG